MTLPIILASTSPRRQQLLSQLHLPFSVRDVKIDERCHECELPHDYIMRMIQAKSEQACKQIEQALVIVADTIGVMGDEILTKPTDKAHAFAMWDKLSDDVHQVWTAVGVNVVKNHQIVCQKIIKVATDVHFIQLTNEQKERYWATGEPADKAGAYAIQGGAMAWVKSINGSYTNVVGLPLAQVAELIYECLAIDND